MLTFSGDCLGGCCYFLSPAGFVLEMEHFWLLASVHPLYNYWFKSTQVQGSFFVPDISFQGFTWTLWQWQHHASDWTTIFIGKHFISSNIFTFSVSGESRNQLGRDGSQGSHSSGLLVRISSQLQKYFGKIRENLSKFCWKYFAKNEKFLEERIVTHSSLTVIANRA